MVKSNLDKQLRIVLKCLPDIAFTTNLQLVMINQLLNFLYLQKFMIICERQRYVAIA